MSKKLSRDELLDEAIEKAKAAEDWQLVEWLRTARGSDSAARWYTQKLDKLKAENEQLRELVRDMFSCINHANEADWFYFKRDEPGCGMSCVVNGEGCGLLALADRMKGLGIEADE